MYEGCIAKDLVVAKIISLYERKEHNSRKKSAIEKQHKFQAFQRAIQCSRCPSKCEKCGAQISRSDQERRQNSQFASKIPYRFCESCFSDYKDYMERLDPKSCLRNSWQNDEWLEAWRRWVEYHSAVGRYLRSKDFISTLREFSQTAPDK